MNATDHSRRSVLVLTHNYPRFPGDVSGVFLRNLLKSLDSSSKFTVLTPHDENLADHDRDQTRNLVRFRYAPEGKETLAYRGEMHTALKSRPFAVWKFFRAYRNAAISEACGAEYDVLWAHWWIPGGWAGAKSSRKSNTPLLLTCHGTDVFLLDKFPWIRRVGARVFRSARQVTVVSSFLKERLVAALGKRVPGLADKVQVIPMPVNDEIFHVDEAVVARKGSIISASRLTEQKHLDKLILAAQRLKHDKLEFGVSLYGDGPEKSRLEALIRDCDLTNEVTIHQPVSQEELAIRYRQSEIAVLVSEREGFGLMLPEAMMCGCAAVGARSGGITDIVREDGVDGIFVEPGDVESLYSTLKKLIVDQDALRKLRKSCSESAQSRFSGDSVSRLFAEVIRRTAVS